MTNIKEMDRTKAFHLVPLAVKVVVLVVVFFK